MLPAATAADLAPSVKIAASAADTRTDLRGTRRVSFPPGHLDHAAGLLRRELLGLYRKLCAGHLFANAAKDLGQGVLEQAYIELGLNIEGYLKSRQVNTRFDPATQQAALQEAQTLWNQIITDYTKQVPSTASQGGFCSCQEHHLLNAAQAPYWLTPTGLLRRILGLSQDFVYRVLNLGLHLAAIQNNVYGLQWVMHQDDRLCPICLGYGTGGDHGFYRLTWFKPDPPPVHPGCRCQYQLIIKK